MRGLRHCRLGATLFLAGLLSALPAGATAASIGPMPPQHPAADCTGYGLGAIDACRAREGVGRLVLPSNWSKLSTDDRLLVLIDLERVNRGLAPMVALVRPLNALAQIGAQRGTDPPFPPSSCGCFSRGGGIFAMSEPPSVFEADELWMYDDASSAWGHRFNILMPGSNIVAGAGSTRDTWDVEMLAGYRAAPAQVTFRWSGELRFFTRRPGLEPRH